MLKKANYLPLFFNLILINLLLGQSDTLYYSANNLPSIKEKAEYFRITRYNPQEKQYAIKERYSNGNLKRIGFAAATNLKDFVGQEYIYYKKDANKLWYKVDYKKNGGTDCYYYYTSTGKLAERCECKNSERVGGATFYDENGKKISEAVFKDNQLIKGIFPFRKTFPFHDYRIYEELGYTFLEKKENTTLELVKKYQNGKEAVRGTVDKNNNLVFAKYFNPKGKYLGTCFYEKATDFFFPSLTPINGLHLTFSEPVKFHSNPAKLQRITTYLDKRKLKEEIFSSAGKSLGVGNFENGYPMDGYFLETKKVVFYKEGIPIRTVYELDKDFNVIAKVTYKRKNPSRLIYTYFDKKGNEIAKGIKINDKLHEGTFKENGFIKSFRNGLQDGLTIYFHSNTKDTAIIFNYKDGRVHGKNISFDKDGKIIAEGLYEDNRPVSGTFLGDKKLLRYEGCRLVASKFFLNKELHLLTEVIYASTEEKELYKAYDGIDNFIGIGIKKDDKSFNGPFWDDNILTTYKNGIKDGLSIEKRIDGSTSSISYFKNDMKDSLTITYKINGKINSSGYYKDGLPYTGTFKKGSKIIAFKNGQQIEKPLVTEDTIFHYSSDNFIKTSYPSKEVVKVFGLASQMEDTTIHIGYKKFDSPFNGTFVDNSSLRSYKDGKLHGKEMKFRELSEPPYYVVNYENGEKDGQAEVMLFDSMFIGTYRADIPYEGSFYIRKKGKGRTKHCILTYKDGQITGDSIIKSDISHISYKNGLPYTGYFPYPNQKEYYERFMLVFHNGIKKQLITLGDGRRDTLFKTYYEHSKSYTKDNNGIIIRETEFLSNKKSGKTIFYPIEEKSIYSIQFRNDTIQNGTYYEILDKETRLGPSSENTHGFSKLFFKNGLLQSYETHFEVDKFYSKYILDNPFPVTLPFVYQPFNFNRNWSGVVEFYDKKTNQYICEFRQKGLYKGYFGIKIERRKNAYFLRQYEDTNQKHFLDNIPWSQLKKKVDEIK